MYVEVCVWCKKVYVLVKSVCVGIQVAKMRFCSSINQSVLLEKSSFIVAQSRSQIEWSGLLKCLSTGSPLLLSRMLLL